MEKRIILGLDVSTACTGVSIVSVNEAGQPKVEYIDMFKFKNSKKYTGSDALFYKLQQFIDRFSKIHDFGFTDIIIEEPLPNSQNRNTLVSLLRFNGMLSQYVWQTTGVIPKYISSYHARRFAFPELLAVRKFNKSGEAYDVHHIETALKKSEVVLFGNYAWDCAKKNILWNLVSEQFPDIQWAYDKKGELIKENFDASDALVCVLGYLNYEKDPSAEPKVVKYEKHTDGNGLNYYDYTFEFIGKSIDKKINIF